jgi:serine phosphatase RsbU (regulator of sigma subunit)
VSAAARYVAGAPDAEVGGDWWDLHDTGGGRVALGIGDVSGRGIPAAAVMGQARAVMRAGGHARLTPVEVLELLDAQLSEAMMIPEQSTRRFPSVSSRTPVRFATACYGVVELDTLRLRLANAGHLPLLLRSTDGKVRRVHAPPGAPLGVGVGGFVEVTEPVEPGDTLVLFTDGLVESRTLDIDDGLAMLADALARDGGGDVESVADALIQAMKTEPGYGADDIALVVLRIDPL